MGMTYNEIEATLDSFVNQNPEFSVRIDHGDDDMTINFFHEDDYPVVPLTINDDELDSEDMEHILISHLRQLIGHNYD